MTVIETPEYKKLALDSSNDMIRHDARRGDGEYALAALHMRQAGVARVRMGQIMFDAGEFTYAAEDWLSAAACFRRVPDLNRMRASLGLVRLLDQEGKIPPERSDLRAALKEREEEFRAIEAKLTRFREDYARMVGPMRTGDQQTLDWLHRQVRELPGYPGLHAEISGLALQLGQRGLAERSLEWARRFDPASPHLAALQASQAFAFGEPARAIQLAREALTAHPDFGYLRILLAQSLAFRAGLQADDHSAADWQAAIEVLQPLVDTPATDAVERLTALSLTVTLQHGLGNETEYRHLLRSFDQLAETVQSQVGQESVFMLRQALPQVFPQPGSNGVSPSAFPKQSSLPKPDYAAVLRVLERLNPINVSIAA